MVNINLSHCLYVLFFTFWHKMQGLIENGARSQLKPTKETRSRINVGFSPLKEDFRCEPGVFNPRLAVAIIGARTRGINGQLRTDRKQYIRCETSVQAVGNVL